MIRGIKRSSLALANDVCSAIDQALGYPRTEQGEQGPPVLTERWATPLALIDGSFFVPCGDVEATAAKLSGVIDLDVSQIKVISETP